MYYNFLSAVTIFLGVAVFLLSFNIFKIVEIVKLIAIAISFTNVAIIPLELKISYLGYL